MKTHKLFLSFVHKCGGTNLPVRLSMCASDFSGVGLIQSACMEKSNFAVPDYMPYCMDNFWNIFLKFPKAMK